MEQSERIKQVLEVLDGIRAAAPASLDALATERKTATKAAASRRGIDERTIADKCWRGLWREKDEKFHIAEFDALAWDWLNGAPNELCARCMDASTNEADRAAVTDFFDGESRVTRYRIRGDCEVWVEPWNSGASIVVNSVGGGPDRRPGLAALLEALARKNMNPAEVGYHPSRRDYVKLEGVPLDVGATLERPYEAAQALHRAAGRVPDGNQGSRLRLVLPDSATEGVEGLLRGLSDGQEATSTLSGQQIVDHVWRSLATEGLDFSKEQVADFYLAVRTKPFVLLAGISGTGKSILARRFAAACGFLAPLIAVRPDWSDPSELLGYRDLEGAFVPGRLIPHLVAAAERPDRPYFVILDEMNLARVEHYFADLLSVIETRRTVGDQVVTDTLDLDIGPETNFRCDAALAARLKDQLADRGLAVPSNLCVVGTVNMDESTHPFSKKVLDRAMTLEFVSVDLRAVPVREEPPTPISVGSGDLDAPHLSLSQVYAGRETFFQPAIDLLVELNGTLAQASMQVGYRTRDEVCLFLFHNGVWNDVGSRVLCSVLNILRVSLREVLPEWG
ncbi:MAG: AAA family ATPase [Deltaproteobacteria bacterium]|nr:AAA family ATPase [Deltaproteobacteria bacterium]